MAKPTLHMVMPPWGGTGVHRTFGWRTPPLACLIVAELARRHGWDVRVVDLNFDSIPDERPDLVGITVWTSLAPAAYEVADSYRAQGVPVVLGGVHASLLPNEALRHADAVVVGEAEHILPRVLDDCLAGRLAGPYEGPWGPMSEVPVVGEWMDLIGGRKFRYLTRNATQTTRGCRFNCDYCSVIRINGRTSRHREPEAVVEEFRTLRRRGQRLGGFCFTVLNDDDLAADLAYTEELARALAKAKLGVAWGTQASIGIAGDPALVRLLRQAGMRAVFTGMESVSREALIECNKKNRPHLYEQAVRRLHDEKIVVESGFIFGLDHDDENVFERTVETADAIGLDSAHFSILTPLPGTHTFARMADEGRITSFDWGRYDLYHCVIEPARMSASTLEAGARRAFRDFYSRRRRTRRIGHQLRYGLGPIMGTAITLNNRDYARHLRDFSTNRPAYVAHPDDLRGVLATSHAPAETAIWKALDQVPVPLRRRTTTTAASES
jgi:radical SAM superfamily enzyme YgiQ (UPF0313 family)